VPTKDEINQFLKELKNCQSIYVVDERQDGKNDETLTILGITPKQRIEEIKALNVENYYRGPTPDHEKPSHSFWEFGKRVKGEEIYIKVKICRTSKGGKYAKCLSFHFAEKPIAYKFKK
jgi:hypothetical protein